MAEVLYIRIDNRSYMLCCYNGVTWRLFNLADRQNIGITCAHTLDFWRRKGVIESEEETKNNGS